MITKMLRSTGSPKRKPVNTSVHSVHQPSHPGLACVAHLTPLSNTSSNSGQHTVKSAIMPSSSSVTVLLQDLAQGDKRALDSLLPLLYTELRRLADSCLRRERNDHTLQPTALVHEAYLRLINQGQPDYRNRSHFYGVAAQVMRQILVDHARARNAAKRGGGAVKLQLNEALSYSDDRASLMVALDDALNTLADHSPTKARLIEMTYFGGLTQEQCGEVLDLPPHTVHRELRLARAWLQRQLSQEEHSASA